MSEISLIQFSKILLFSACTIAVGLVEELAEFQNTTITGALDKFCSFLPQGEYSTACYEVVGFLGPLAEKL